MTDTGVAIAFWGLGALAVFSALGIVLSQNLLHAVLLLILCFFALAGLFVTLTADFIAVAQVLIYAGAIGVLIIFAIMLTPTPGRQNSDTVFFGPAFVIGGFIAIVMAVVAFRTPWPVVERDGFTTTANLIGEALVGRWALAFQIAAILLTIAMIGAIVIVRSPAEDGDDDAGRPPLDTPDDQTGAEDRALVASGTNNDGSRA
jgi:NADH:ubiquinone oxidoreductase subunit 6 (subunit J)